jgi:hypothetical protein
MSDKLDLKKKHRERYRASAKKIAVIDVPPLDIISVDGGGDPNTSREFSAAVEGLWWAKDMTRFLTGGKEHWFWKAFIVVPDFITAGFVDRAREAAAKKKDLPAADRLRFERFEEGRAAQVLHVGPYADEAPTIVMLHEYIAGAGFAFDGLIRKHHEIYLSDMRRTAPEKLKTIIRQPFA